MKVAAIDIGSNSTRLLVADVKASQVQPFGTGLITTRLGQGITQGMLTAGAMERTVAAVLDFVQQAKQAGAQKIILAATSAVRDATNQDEFVAAIARATGERLLVLSGTQEARLVFLGVTCSLGQAQNAVVVDVGGGSTEFIWYRQGRLQLVSAPVGAVRMTELGFGQGQVQGALGDTLEAIKKDQPHLAIGVGGSITTLAAIAQSLKHYDPNLIHGYSLKREQVDLIYQQLIALTVPQRAQLPGLAPLRADIIPAGCWIVSRILHGLGQSSLTVSEADLLYGLVLEAAKS